VVLGGYLFSQHQAFPYFPFSVRFFQVVEIAAYDYMGGVEANLTQSLPHRRLSTSTPIRLRCVQSIC
jgi:hypothetical protein